MLPGRGRLAARAEDFRVDQAPEPLAQGGQRGRCAARGRIPAVFVHGTTSSAGRWADMYNDLANDARVRDRFGRRPIDKLDMRPETRELLERALLVRPLPFVRRVIFVVTPHGGSSLTASSVARWLARFVTLPRDVLGATAVTASLRIDRRAGCAGPTGRGGAGVPAGAPPRPWRTEARLRDGHDLLPSIL